MNETISISVIIPVYNVEGYIGRCIESLQVQTLKELEFIFVDDCSTDDSIAAVEAWAAQDERVRILRNKENLGPGPSRNHGIDAARGDYLSFVDPDDYISPDFYELLYAAAIADGGHDIAKGSVRKVDEDTNAIGSIESKQNERIKNRDKKGMPLFRVFTYEHWTALYRASLFSDGTARYGTSGKDQDTTFQLSICLKTEDLVLAEEATYYYVQRSGSIVHSTSVQRFFDELDALEEKVAILNARGIDDDAVRYLAVKLKVRRRNYETAIEGNPELQAAASSYYQRMDEILESIPNAGSYRVIQDARWGNLAGGDSLTNPHVSLLSKLKRRLWSTAHVIKRRFINNA